MDSGHALMFRISVLLYIICSEPNHETATLANLQQYGHVITNNLTTIVYASLCNS